MKKILITGANSYIGDAVKSYLNRYDDKYNVRIKDTVDWVPEISDFSGVDVVFNVAGIAHIKETNKNKMLYYKVNRDLVIDIAKAAKSGGVKQFILLSTMSVYGLLSGYIDKKTLENPQNAYGKSKQDADYKIKKLRDVNFKFACIRPPMVYGRGCKGNYQRLRNFALKSPIFPDYDNKRSMIFIGNLCSFIKDVIDNEKDGVFFPQNAEYINTSEMVKMIALNHNKRIVLTKIFNPIINLLSIDIMNKVFGDLIYEPVDRVDTYSFEESMRLTEK